MRRHDEHLAGFENELIRAVYRHRLALLKAPIIGAMTACTVWIVSASTGKTLLVGMLCFAAALFTTWRRFLEPMSFWLFTFAVISWCDPNIVLRVKTAIISLGALG